MGKCVIGGSFQLCSCKTLQIFVPFVCILCSYSGFTFSHYDLPFPTRCCIPYLRSGLYQLVIRVKGFRVFSQWPRLRIAFGFVHRHGHHAFSESSFVSLAHGPRWLFLLSRHRKTISAAANQKPFVNKDLCTRKSVKRTIKWWEPNALLQLGNLKCQVVLVGS